jgi:two-component system, cell cycle response regulator
MNILIVESSKTFQRAIEKIFRPYATNIFISSIGSDGIDVYSSVRIDMICVSYYLKDMDGIDFVSKIRKTKYGETIQILMLTSKKDYESATKSLQSGVTEIFNKNNIDDLEKYLKKVSEHARQQSQIIGNILLIDKDIVQSGEIKSYFKDTKLKFVHFTSAEEASEIIKAAEFDLVITEIVLDGSMSGVALIREIREINETMYRVPILVISKISNISQKIGLFRAGANDYIQKPLLLEELSVRMKNLLQNKKLFDTVECQKLLLEKLASRDQLTGLYNRHYLSGMADKAIQESYRYEYPFSVLFIDLDHFKIINDTQGHSVGDIVLKSVATLLLKTFRGVDTPVRFGGEEFLILLPHCDGKNAVARAETLLAQIRMLRPNSLSITASIGVSQTSQNYQVSANELFATADEAVYAAKSLGRDCVVFREASMQCNLNDLSKNPCKY